MASDFTKYTNYLNNAGVTGVVFGADSPILEVELNEMQEIQKDEIINILKNIILDGKRNGILNFVFEDGTNDYTIKKGSAFLFNELLLLLKKDIVIEKDNTKPYLILEIESHKGVPETFKEYGYLDSSTEINDWAEDSRYNEVTSMRKYTTFSFVTSSSTSVSTGQFLIGQYDYTNNIFNPYNYYEDSNFYFDVIASCSVVSNEYVISRSDLELQAGVPNGNKLEVDVRNLKCFVNGFEFPVKNQNGRNLSNTFRMEFQYDRSLDNYKFRFFDSSNTLYTYGANNEVIVVFPVKLITVAGEE